MLRRGLHSSTIRSCILATTTSMSQDPVVNIHLKALTYSKTFFGSAGGIDSGAPAGTKPIKPTKPDAPSGAEHPAAVAARARAEAKRKEQQEAAAAGGGGKKGGKGGKEAEAADGDNEDKLTITDAVDGAVVTRFPPEASGFLHIGHAKAALVNRMLADKYHGKTLLRFDDTNPSKEKHEFEHAILEDLRTLGVTCDSGPTYSSDYMDLYLSKANELLDNGLAYCDTTEREALQKARFEGTATACRDNSVEENKRLFNEMLNATEEGQKACLRAKISVTAENKALRDPVIYRVNTTPHARQGEKYKAYPTYDFCCPLIDSVEGVTHALRTNEYHDRNDQYYWVLDALKMRKPIIEDFSRLNMEYAVMSKRKLTQLVNDNVVDGWDDPRFPTVRALVRRGLKIDALREFVKVQGMSKAVNFMEWSKLWNFNVQILDPSVPRYSAVSKELATVCTVVGSTAAEKESLPEQLTRQRHKKNPELGDKTYYRHSKLLLEAEDVALLADGDEVTLMDWGNVFVRNIQKAEGSSLPTSADIELNLSGDFRKTKYKLTWVPDTASSENNSNADGSVKVTTTPIICNEYDHLLTKKKPDPEEPIDNVLAPVTKFTQHCVGEAALSELKRGDFLQLERRGYYVVDTATPDDGPLILIAIPDGRDKVNHLSAKYQYMKTLPGGIPSGDNKAGGGGKGGNAAPKGGAKADASLEEKKAAKAAKKAAGNKKE